MASVHGNPRLLYVTPSKGNRHTSPFVVHETKPAEPRKPRLLDRVRAAVRTRHYSPRTEEAYVAWIRRYILFHDKRHPAEMGAPEISRFVSALAVEGNVAASTQNQALSALLFLYGDVLEVDLPWLDDIVRANCARIGSSNDQLAEPQRQGVEPRAPVARGSRCSPRPLSAGVRHTADGLPARLYCCHE